MPDADPPPPARPPPLPPPLAPAPPVAAAGGRGIVLPYAVPPHPLQPKPENPRARRLIFWSKLLGYGGVLLFVTGSCAGGLARQEPGQGTAGVIVLAVGLIAAVVGAVVGQIGRAMQGRVI